MEETQLTRTAEDYLVELRENHKKAEQSVKDFFEYSKRSGELLLLAKAEIGRGFRAYCERAGIPKTTAYRYIEIYNNRDAIQSILENRNISAVQALALIKRESDRQSDKPIEIDITPKTVVIEPPPEPPPEQQNLFDPEEHRAKKDESEKDRKKREDNNYRARLNTSNKNKCISMEDRTRRLSELDQYILDAETLASGYEEKANYQRNKKANYEIEKGEVSNYRIK
jgi:hypothetical protein